MWVDSSPDGCAGWSGCAPLRPPPEPAAGWGFRWRRRWRDEVGSEGLVSSGSLPIGLSRRSGVTCSTRRGGRHVETARPDGNQPGRCPKIIEQAAPLLGIAFADTCPPSTVVWRDRPGDFGSSRPMAMFPFASARHHAEVEYVWTPLGSPFRLNPIGNVHQKPRLHIRS
jgi:hypothetical protein